ncbi:MAG: replicative DNA helicase [Candidatus Omnitrophica bacterium]|jgi:replicative DNA helicase|nr:replicative DNA helicase [Candidatus Omnitrophota bacterium]MCF7891759.1 replicative DNA helicase [Candidatus Omnitrophota bacterium]MCF7895523.1 replicative DNA helicase [Candidatus Omnitrophota bacterium]MCF7909428.1 replicative DNA helicase [Candidatus Omnitrophota bacterium]
MDSKSPAQNINKIPPQSIEAEMATLGAMLQNEKVISEIVEITDSSLFYKKEHKIIFETILELYDERNKIDILTVSERLRKKNFLNKVGGTTQLTTLADFVPSSANASDYARIVKEKGVLRALIENSSEIISLSYKGEEEVSSLLDKAERLIFDISDRRVEGGYVHIKDIIKDGIELIESLYHKKSHVTGVPTGFRDLDLKTAGFQKGDLVIVAGRPSMGKSALVTSITGHVAINKKIPVGIFSLEMSKEQLMQRFLCAEAKVEVNRVRTGFLSPSEWPTLTSAAGRLSEAPIYIDDTPALNIFEIRAKARRLKAHHDIQLILVDYLQLIRGAGRTESRQQEISNISQGLKALAKELGVPLIAVSQLSRAVESREGHRPKLSDLRESGAIEQDADLVVLLFREEYYQPNDENKGIAEAIIAKQRNGPVGTINLAFLKEYMRFADLAK